MSLEKQAVSITQIEPHGPQPYVPEDGSYYNVRIQLGAKRTWREYGSGKWEQDPERRPTHPGQIPMRHAPAVHLVRPAVSAEILNGLISEHNKYLQDRREQKQPFNDIGYQLLVTGYEKTAAPELRSAALPPGFKEMLAEMAGQVAERVAKATVAALGAS